MALDESRHEDVIFDVKGLTYVIEKELFERVSPIKVDYVDRPGGGGFSISSGMDGNEACSRSSRACKA
jgi:Fe-S cluster assembly iron-binding protein IscA